MYNENGILCFYFYSWGYMYGVCLHLPLCVRVCVPAHMCMQAQLHKCARVHVEANGHHGFSSSIPCFWRQNLFWTKSSQVQLDWLAVSSIGPCLCIPSAGVIDAHPMPAFCVGAGEPDSGPHVCVTDILPTGPSPQPWILYYFSVPWH